MREIKDMADLKNAQQEIRYKIQMKELEVGAHLNAVKEYLNPLTYINYAISKITVLEQLVTSFYKGYNTVKEMIQNYRTKKENQQTDIIPDNNQQ